MTPPVFPELALIAKVETIEAIAFNIEEAILFEIGAVVGTEDAPATPFTAADDCEFFTGSGTVNRTIAAMLRLICQGFQSLTLRFIDVADALGATIRNFLDSFLQGVVDQFNSLLDAITTRLSAVVNTIVETVSDLIDTIVERLGALVSALVGAVQQVIEKLEDILSAIFNKIADVVQSIFNKIADVFTGLLNAATAVFNAIKSGVTTVLDALLNAAEFVFDKIGGALTGLIETLTGVAEGGLAKIRSVIESIPATLRELAIDAQEFLGTAIGSPLASIGTLFSVQTDEFFKKLIEERDRTPEDMLREFLTDIGTPADVAEKVAGASTKLLPTSPALLALAGTAIIPFVLGPVISAIVSPVTDQIRQEVAQRVTPTLIPPADTIDAFIRGFMTEAQFRNELGEAGFNNTKQDVLLATSRRLMDIGEIFRWWLRDIITEDQLNTLLTFHRIDSDDQARLKEAVFFIPPVGDLIRMAVREVFTPDIRERFGQDEGFPDELVEFGKQQGLSEFWAKAFWAAHWTLPSPQQGFEMLHRKVIDTDDLDLLLRAQDVMPFWRDKLVQIAFNPLTRVDLRRMHRLGLLDEEQLQLRYEDLGFNVDNAALMVQFTLAFNVTDESEAEQEIEGLTRATVVNMMEDGILQEGEALEILAQMGLSERVALLFVEQRKLEIQRRDRKELIENVIRLVGGGIINFPQAQDSLAQLGLTAIEIARATQRILAALGGRDRLPTQAQIDKMLASEIITEEVWKETMEGLNFPDVWITRILELNQSGGTA